MLLFIFHHFCINHHVFIGILMIFFNVKLSYYYVINYIINYSDILYFSHFGTDDKYFQLFLVVCSAKFIDWAGLFAGLGENGRTPSTHHSHTSTKIK